MIKENSIPNTLSSIESKLEHLLATTKTSSDILTTEEVAKYLNLALGTIYNLTSRNEIPFHRAKGRRRIYFKKSEINEWIMFNSNNQPNL